MSSSGTGVDSNSMGSSQQLYYQFSTSAQAAYSRVYVGAVKDPVAQSFTLSQPLYTTGSSGELSYRTSSDRPLLDHSLFSTRSLSANLENDSDQTWSSTYDELVQSLPDDIRSALSTEMAKSAAQRNYVYVALNQTLIWTAQTLSQLELVGSAPSVDQTRAIALAMESSALYLGYEFSAALQEHYEIEGVNTPYSEVVTGVLAQTNANFKLMEKLVENLANLPPDGELSDNDKTNAQDLAKDFHRMSVELSQIPGNQHGALQSTLDLLSTVTSALSLPVSGSAPLYVQLNASLIGNQSNPSVQAVINALTDGMSSTALSGSNQATQNLLNMTLSAVYSGLIGIASLAAQPVGDTLNPASINAIDPISLATLLGSISPTLHTGTGDPLLLLMGGVGVLGFIGFTLLSDDIYHPSHEDSNTAKEKIKTNIETAKSFTFDMIVRILTSSNILSNIFDELLSVCKCRPTALKLASPILTQIAHLLIILAGTRNSKRFPPELLIGAEAKHIETGVSAAAELVANINQDDHPRSQEIVLAINQLIIALKEADYTGFLEVIDRLLETLNTSKTAFLSDIDSINQMALIIKRTIKNRKYDLPGSEVVALA